MRSRWLVALAALVLLPVGPAAAAAGPVVHTDAGPVRGTTVDGLRLFQGIPFAAPPVGDLRWEPPRPVAPWTGVYDATAPRSQCAQLDGVGGTGATFVEDCLYLNVTAPVRRHHGRPLPVMVWVHGGSNLTGAGHVYDASKLVAEGDVVVVTVNYRLGALGWLAHRSFSDGSGNYGLLDQQAALRWVKRNAAAFGGDPGNVTLFGESAGAADTCAQLVSPRAAGLFHKAIPQSYSCAAPVRTREEASASADALAQAVGCASADCLRGVPVKTLLENDSVGFPGPVLDPELLPVQPLEAIESGRFNRVPMMHGNTLDETRLFTALAFPQEISAETYAAVIAGTFGDRAAEVLARYPASAYASPRIALATVRSHFGTPLSTCTHLDGYGALAEAGVPVYAYQFADRNAPPLVDFPAYEEGADHATELTFLWPGLLGELDSAQQGLSGTMVRYWTSFAHKGFPVAPRSPRWPRFAEAGEVLSLAPGAITPADVSIPSNCAFWEN
jgi:para-nitrobenzyl esterase